MADGIAITQSIADIEDSLRHALYHLEQSNLDAEGEYGVGPVRSAASKTATVRGTIQGLMAACKSKDAQVLRLELKYYREMYAKASLGIDLCEAKIKEKEQPNANAT